MFSACSATGRLINMPRSDVSVAFQSSVFKTVFKPWSLLRGTST